jgi:hypothetical protein
MRPQQLFSVTIVDPSFRTVLSVLVLGCASTHPQRRDETTAAPDSAHETSPTARTGPAQDYAHLSPAILAACDPAADFLARWPRARVATDSSFEVSARYAGPKRLGCRVIGVGTTRGASASLDSLIATYRVQGWDWAKAFDADGPDGSVTALHSHSITCIFEGQWDGGDDADSTYVPSDSLTLSTTCMQLIESDTL